MGSHQDLTESLKKERNASELLESIADFGSSTTEEQPERTSNEEYFLVLYSTCRNNVF